MTLVSYIVPCFNCEKYIVTCLSSILTQQNLGVEVEIVVVDDGSSDGSVDLIESFMLSHPESRTSLFHHPGRINKGVSATRKVGVDHAQAEYICFLDADDYLIDKNKTRLQLEEFKAESSLVMIHSAVEVIGHQANREGDALNFKANCGRGVYSLASLQDWLANNHVCNSTVMVKRSALDHVLFDAPQCFQYEDWAMWLLLSRQGSFKCLANETVAYRLHPESSTALVSRNQLRSYYSQIECKFIVLTRAGCSVLGLKVFFSLRHDVIALLRKYSYQSASDTLLPKRHRLLAVILETLLSPVFFSRKIWARRSSLHFIESR
jgi:glycosyltransferase involved in cell wall biosynthesis